VDFQLIDAGKQRGGQILDALRGLDLHVAYSSSSITGLCRQPISAISMSTTSPGRRLPTPAGVTVAITSPGHSVITRDTKDTSVGTSNTMSATLASCLISPLTRVVRCSVVG